MKGNFDPEMPEFCELIACPQCRGPISERMTCDNCGAIYDLSDGIANLRLPADSRTEVVRQFYHRTPFPAYRRYETLASLRQRAERSEFARLLDEAIPGDARIAEVGCGTGQMSLYLARADRFVIGADISRPSLLLAAAAARRFGIASVRFVETDLQRSGLKPGTFDVVYSSGVLHHTPDPRGAFRSVSRLVKPGGIVVLGLYNAVARLPHRLRRLVARICDYRWVPFDPVLRERYGEPERREAWLLDQYCHPEEHRHTLGQVRKWFRENGIEYLRAYPSTLLGGDTASLFAKAEDDWTVEAWLAQAAWMATLGHEGGLFVTVGRKAA